MRGSVDRINPRPACLPRFICAALALVIAGAGCGALPARLLSNESADPVDTDRFELLARLVHISDAQIVDEESPGRLAALGNLVSTAWRPQEAYSTQLLDGMIRTINRMHVARGAIDFVIFTGDAADNAQLNELGWFIKVFDGGTIDPLTGPDDRAPASRPEPALDPHHSFTAQGLYRQGLHGGAATIPWYTLLGNHDRFAVGVFPIVTNLLGQRISPLPLQNRIPLTLPVILNPVGNLSWAPITPAYPGPPPELSLPVVVPAHPDRRFTTDRDFVGACLQSVSEPPGHGFDAEHPDQTWYSVSPVAGLRLIALNSATPLLELPGFAYSEGALSFPQAWFLRRELEQAQQRGERVIVATHHPSESLEPVYGTALTPQTFTELLNAFPCVKLHLAGHWHRNVVIDRGGYLEIVTGSVIDAPQQGRVIEIWRERLSETPAVGGADDRAPSDDTQLRYWMFSHLDVIDPPDASHAGLFSDPLMPLRRIAADLAGVVTAP